MELRHLRPHGIGFCVYVAGMESQMGERQRRGVGRPSKAQPFRTFVVDLLLANPRTRNSLSARSMRAAASRKSRPNEVTLTSSES